MESITEQLIEHIKERDRFGIEKYGHSLRAFDGRRNLTDALDEVLDLAQYLMKEIEERNVLEGAVERVIDLSACNCTRHCCRGHEGHGCF